MIISHRHRFIFQHCRKTGGSSIKAALMPHVGPLDFILGAGKDGWRAGNKANLRTRLDLLHPELLLRIVYSSLVTGRARPDLLRKRLYRSSLGGAPEHAPAHLVQEFNPKAWGDYFKFCFVRNPYDKAVSDWRWRTRRTGTPCSFSNWLRIVADGEPHPLLPPITDNWPIYTISNEIAVDYVGRFENFGEDVRKILMRIGLADVGDIPWMKRGDLPADSYRDYYSGEDRKIVARLFAKEIDAFGYRF